MPRPNGMDLTKACLQKAEIEPLIDLNPNVYASAFKIATKPNNSWVMSMNETMRYLIINLLKIQFMNVIEVPQGIKIKRTINLHLYDTF